MKGFRQVEVDMRVFELFDMIIKGGVFRINDAWDKCICSLSDFLSNFNGDICNHVVVNHIFVGSFDFCHDVVIVACFVVSKTCEGNFSVFVITCLRNDLAFIITKVKGELTCF